MDRRTVTAIGVAATLVTAGWTGLMAGSPSSAQAVARNAPSQKGKPVDSFATFTTLPSFGRGSDARAVDDSGTLIAGTAWDSAGLLHAVKWTLEDGAWTMTDLSWPAGSTSSTARAVNNFGEVSGNDHPTRTGHALLWSPAGDITVLGCDPDPGELSGAYGLSANAQVIVGNVIYLTPAREIIRSAASVWRPGACRDELPPLDGDGSSSAMTANGDGTVVGGGSSGRPVLWRQVAGAWEIEALDALDGSVRNGNAAGDMAGHVYVPCGAGTCQRGSIWYAAGGSRQLGTLGGSASTVADINADGEAAGMSAVSAGRRAEEQRPYFWSVATGMRALPFSGRQAVAWALSDVRADGTRVIVGMNANSEAMVWVVKNP
jgi:uncharacterized membrane protein